MDARLATDDGWESRQRWGVELEPEATNCGSFGLLVRRAAAVIFRTGSASAVAAGE